jgi:hypothetical protein
VAAGPTPPPDVFAVPAAAPMGDVEPGSSGTSGDESLDAEIHLDFQWGATTPFLAPVALLGLPALLIVVQLVGGVLWIPLTSRILGAPAGARPRR